MYTFELNIGSLTTPVIGGGYISVDPIFSQTGVNKSRGSNDLLTRNNLSGDLEFRGDDYTALRTLYEADELYVDIKVYYNTTNILTGNLGLNGKYTTNSNICKLTFTQDDLYGKILANTDKEFNLISFPDLISHDFTTSIRNRYQARIWAGGATYQTWDRYSSNGIYAVTAWDSGTTYNAGQLLITDLYWGWDGVNTIVSSGGQIFVSLIDSNLNNLPTPGGDANWIRVETAPPNYTMEYADFAFPAPNNPTAVFKEAQTEANDDHWDEWQQGGTGTNNYTMTKACRSVFDVLESLLNEIDSSIEIYETTSGANTGYCEYTENSFGNSHYKFVTSWDDEPKLGLQEILTFYKTIHNCDWRFEGNIFVFRHPSERPAAVGGTAPYDLTTYKSNDWTKYEEQTDVVDNISRESWKFADSNHADWDKSEFTYDNNFNDSTEYAIGFETDIKHTLVKEDGNLIIAAVYTSQWDLTNATGIISGETEYNGYLAVSFCVFYHHRYGRPFNLGVFSADSVEYALIKKRNTIVNIEVPYFDPDIIDQENYLVKTNNGNFEVREINIKLGGGNAELICVK